jgi:hypothetical protein
LPEWLREAEKEAAAGEIPVVPFRQNEGDWYAALPLAALIMLASSSSAGVDALKAVQRGVPNKAAMFEELREISVHLNRMRKLVAQGSESPGGS